MSDSQVDEFNPDDFQDPDPRLPRGYLTLDIYNVCIQFDKGELTLDEGRYMTSYVMQKILIEDNPGRPKPPSTGAIAANFHRWDAWGFAEFRRNPFAFVKFTDKGKELGLEGMLAERSNLKKEDQAWHRS